MLTAATMPADVYINLKRTRPLASPVKLRLAPRLRNVLPVAQPGTISFRPLGAVAVPGMPGRAGVVFRGPGLGDGVVGTGFYWGLALGALGMYGIMRFLG